jgi:hypothetical protein
VNYSYWKPWYSSYPVYQYPYPYAYQYPYQYAPPVKTCWPYDPWY